MTKLPRVTGRQLVAALCQGGFEVIRVKGSYHFMRHPGGKSTVVPVHRGETIGPGLMSQILRDCEITREELIELLKST